MSSGAGPLALKIAVVETLAVVSTAVSAAIATATAVTTTVTAAAAAKVALFVTAAAAAFGLGTTFVNDHIAAVNLCAIKGCDGSLSLVVVRHFHKAETFAAASEFVCNDFSRGYVAMRCKQIEQILIFKVPAQISYVNVHVNTFLKNKQCQQ